MSLKPLIYICVLLIIPKIWVTQSSNDAINIYSVNTKYLEHLIKIKVDSIRRIYEAKPLINDSILFVAAKGHGNWMNKNNKFSHFEKKNSKKKTPQLRAEFHGAVNYRVGENIIKSYVGKVLEDKKGNEYTNITYEDLANDFVLGWVNSPPHFANIKTKDYQVTGVAVSINSEKGLVYAVQKFAVIDFKYDFEENKEMFSYSGFTPEPTPVSFKNVSREKIKKKYAWGIKAPKDSAKRCDACNKAIDIRPYKEHFDRKGRRMVIQSFNIAVLEEIIQKRRDGFALEIVSYNPFDCGNPEYYTKPSRRNNQSLINGVILEPVYKKALKKGFKKAKYSKYFHIKKKGTAKSFEMSLGKLPKDLGGYYEVNILVLKRKRVCRVIHFTGFCGEPMMDSITPRMLLIENNYPSENPIRKGVIHFKIPFEKGKYEFTYSDVEPLLGIFSRNNFTVDSASVRAYSSMEGTVEVNNNLQRKRANSIVNIFEEKQTSKFKTNIETYPNWYFFKKQIEINSKLSDLQELDSLTIIDKLKDKDYAKSIEPFLAKQRYGVVDLYVDYKINLEDLADTLLAELKRYCFGETIKQLNYNVKSVKIFEIQYKLFELVRDGYCDVQKFDDFASIIRGVDQLFMDQQYWLYKRLNRFNNEKEEYSFLVKMTQKSFKAAFNRFGIAMIALQNGKYYSKEDNETLDTALFKLKMHVPLEFKSAVDSLEIAFYSEMVELSGLQGKSRNDELLKMYSEKLVSKAISLRLEENNIIKIAKLMLIEEQDNQAYKILNYQIQEGSVFEETKILFAKLGFYHVEEYHSRNYSEALIQLYAEISEKSWCEMFVGPCNISFQVFDDELLRNFYCSKCSEYKNYAQDPSKW